MNEIIIWLTKVNEKVNLMNIINLLTMTQTIKITATLTKTIILAQSRVRFIKIYTFKFSLFCQ